jgi:HKD family nuclease
VVTFDVVSNGAGHTTRDVLRSALRADVVQSLRVAVSYLMTSGVPPVRQDLERIIAAGAEVTIVFGDDFHLTQSAALAALMNLGCDLRLYAGVTRRGYHPKVWLVDYINGQRTALVGSSNLSYGGLVSNAEASVLLEGDTTELDQFDKLWQTFDDQSRVFEHADLQSYIDAEKAAAVPHLPAKFSKATAQAALRELLDHIARWQRYIASPQRIGQADKWRGWYLVPEQGQLTQAKLGELAKILNGIAAVPKYRRDLRISFGTDALGVQNAVDLLRFAGVTTKHTFTPRARRDLFVRQQRLYLQTFGWIEQLDRDHFVITQDGQRFRRATTAAARARLFTKAISQVRWPFGPIAYYPFLLNVLARVPNGRLYYDEMSLIIIHSYHSGELAGTVNLVGAYRALSTDDRKSLSDSADSELRRLLSAHAGGTAYGRYRRKVADLLVAFGSTSGLRYVSAAEEDRSYIEFDGGRTGAIQDGTNGDGL